jgi:hypothetical protein
VENLGLQGNVMTKFSELFEGHGLSPLPDAELEAALLEVSQHMAKEDVAAYIVKVKRFDTRPMHVTESLPGQEQIDINNSRLVYWWYLRQDMEIIPAFFSAFKAMKMSYKHSVDLLFNLADSNRYDFGGVYSLIKNVTLIAELLAVRGSGAKFPLRDFKTLLKIARDDGDVARAIAIMRLGVAAGLDMTQSMGIVRLIYKEGGIAGYVFKSLYDELELLGPNAIDAQLLYRSLQAAIKGDLGFTNFTHLLYAAATRTSLSHADIFSKLTKALEDRQQRKLASAGSDYQAASKVLFPSMKSDKATLKVREEYFPEIGDTALRPGILPYRMPRSLEDGLQDLKAMVHLTLTEGAWIYDPDQSIWYSLGGRTELGNQTVRHDAMPYDVALLSRNPVFVHMHPKEAEIFITPDRNTLAFPQLQKKMTAFLTCMPSGADFQVLFDLMKAASGPVSVTGLIVTSHGVTEFTCPCDERSVFDIAKSFQAWKNAVFMEKFDTLDYMKRFGIKEPDAIFINKVLSVLIDELPEGYDIRCRFNDEGAFHALAG